MNKNLDKSQAPHLESTELEQESELELVDDCLTEVCASVTTAMIVPKRVLEAFSY